MAHTFKHPQILSQKHLIYVQIHSGNDLCIFINKYNRKKIHYNFKIVKTM